MVGEIKTEIVAVTRAEPPFTYPCVFVNPEAPDCEGGINFEIFRALMSGLGIKYRLIQAELGATGYMDANGTWWGMVAQLGRGEADMSATITIIDPTRYQVVDFSVPVSYFINGFLINSPKALDIKGNSLQFLISPLSGPVWL